MDGKLNDILKNIHEQSETGECFFNSIHNIRSEKEAVIMATGPTISKYSDKQYNDFLKDKDLFSIKQVFDKLPQYTDVHFFNCCNLPKQNGEVGYSYNKYRPFVVASSNFPNGGGRWPSSQFMHLFFKIPAVPIAGPDVLWNSKKFEDFLFENTLQRPCGPGIFLETVLFFVLHLGYKNIYTIGWDYSKTNESYGHFYNENKKATNVATPSVFQSANESNKSIELTGEIAKWLKSKNVSLKVVGDISCVSSEFERVGL